tara:strand:+ start:1659 stop:1964 length:306 start_codon:yes stop_codon:yes gene_type:complete
MSTYYRPTNPIPIEMVNELKNISVIHDKEQDRLMIFDGVNYLHFYCNDDNDIIDIIRYGLNDPTDIFETLESAFQVSMISEYEKEYQEIEDKDTKMITIQF